MIGTSAVDDVSIPDVLFTLLYKDTILCVDDEIQVNRYLCEQGHLKFGNKSLQINSVNNDDL